LCKLLVFFLEGETITPAGRFNGTPHDNNIIRCTKCRAINPILNPASRTPVSTPTEDVVDLSPHTPLWIKKSATTKGYRKGLACWAAFCGRRQFTNKNLIHEKKVLLFLKEEVLTIRTRKKKARGTNKRRAPSNTLSAEVQMQPLRPKRLRPAMSRR
jgi:hypothetical protein